MPKSDDHEFLTGPELSNRIRQVCDASNVKCAVAFWGVGMRQELFPRWTAGGIQIVCDISMGATCRAALIELGAPRNDNLRVRDGLHGKVYISEHGAVIGSPNASSGGVGTIFGSAGRLLEAGVFCAVGTNAYEAAIIWFDSVFEAAPVIWEADLLRAPERSGELRPRASRQQLAKLSLLRRLRDYPQNFSGIHVAIATGDLDETKAIISKEDLAAARGIKVREIEGDLVIQDGKDGTLYPFMGSFLLLWKNGKSVEVTAYVNGYTWPNKNPDSVFGTEEWVRFWSDIDQSPPAEALNKDESILIAQMLNGDDAQWLFTADEFAGKLVALSREAPSETQRVTESQARAVMAEERARVGLQSLGDLVVHHTVRCEARTLRWWHQNAVTRGRSDTRRSLALLRAYGRIAPNGKLHAGGLPLDRGYIWMDRSVISRFERDGYLRFQNDGTDSWFTLTDEGQALAALDHDRTTRRWPE